MHVRGAGLFSPGFADARAFVEGHPDASVVLPREDALPPRARRGTSVLTRMAADVAHQATTAAGFDPVTVQLVYASAYGEVSTALALVKMRHEGDGRLSPARFHTSVHNTPTGLLSIAHCNKAFSTAIAAGPRTVAMGLLEAAALFQDSPGPIVVVFADEPVPSAFDPDLDFPPLAVALALTNDATGAMATIEGLRFEPRGEVWTSSGPLARNPAAYALPLLRAIFAAQPAIVAIDPDPNNPLHAIVSAPPGAPPKLPPLAELVRHRAPMLLLDEVVRWDGASVECLVVLRDDSPFVEAGRVRGVLAVEYMAQCMAAYDGLRRRDRGQPPSVGYLVGGSEIQISVDHFLVGDVLRVHATHVSGNDALARFDCTVERDGDEVAKGTLNAFRQDPWRPDRA
jgi:predicted hotdog family 3-hydroxylacyl-ACP dehydratase